MDLIFIAKREKAVIASRKRCNRHIRSDNKETQRLNLNGSSTPVIACKPDCCTIFSASPLDGKILIHCNLSQKNVRSLKSIISRDIICLPEKRTRNWSSLGDGSRRGWQVTPKLKTLHSWLQRVRILRTQNPSALSYLPPPHSLPSCLCVWPRWLPSKIFWNVLTYRALDSTNPETKQCHQTAKEMDSREYPTNGQTRAFGLQLSFVL